MWVRKRPTTQPKPQSTVDSSIWNSWNLKDYWTTPWKNGQNSLCVSSSLELTQALTHSCTHTRMRTCARAHTHTHTHLYLHFDHCLTEATWSPFTRRWSQTDSHNGNFTGYVAASLGCSSNPSPMGERNIHPPMGLPHHSEWEGRAAVQSDGTVRPSRALDYLSNLIPTLCEVIPGNKHRVQQQHHVGNTATCASTSDYRHTRHAHKTHTHTFK